MNKSKLKSQTGWNKLFLKIETSAFFSFASPLTINKAWGAVKIAVQDHLGRCLSVKHAGNDNRRVANELVCAGCFQTTLIEIAKYFCFVLWIDLDNDSVDLVFCSVISFPDTANSFCWRIGSFHKRWKQNCKDDY